MKSITRRESGRENGSRHGVTCWPKGRSVISLNLKFELESLVDALIREGVDFAICGGVAVTIHGAPRFTKDIDLLIESGALERCLSAARQSGFDLRAQPMTFDRGTDRERTIHRVSKVDGKDLLTLDLIVLPAPLHDVWKSRVLVQWENRRVPVVSLDGLVKMKMLAGRDQDLLDVKALGRGHDDENGDQR